MKILSWEGRALQAIAGADGEGSKGKSYRGSTLLKGFKIRQKEMKF